MSAIVNAIVPMFALIAAGYVIRRGQVVSDALWAPVEGLVYRVCFPALLVVDIASIPAFDARMAQTLAVVAGVTLVAAAAAVATHRVWAHDGPSFTSFFQGAVRFNSYILIGVAPSLPEPGAAGLIGVVIAGMVIMSNTLSVAVFSAFSNNPGKRGLVGLIGQLLTNPLVVASLLGIALSATKTHLPIAVARALSIAGAAALPLALFSIGAGLRLERSQLTHRSLWLSCGIKLVALPLCVAALTRLWGMSASFAHVALLYALVPPATSSYVLARQLGGDAPLMASILSVSTALSLLTIPSLYAALA